jgi:hypothetical protein
MSQAKRKRTSGDESNLRVEDTHVSESLQAYCELKYRS